MLVALRADRPDMPVECYARFRVSTADSRYAMVGNAPLARCGGGWEVLLVRSSARWFVHGAGSEWYCDDPYRTAPARVLKELLTPAGCVRTQASEDFVTPSNNIACAYRPGPYNQTYQRDDAGKLWCYVRSSRTLLSMWDVGATQVVVRRGVSPPEGLRSLNGPVLEYGSAWRTQYWIRCVSRATSLQCTGGRGAGFVASRDGVRLLG